MAVAPPAGDGDRAVKRMTQRAYWRTLRWLGFRKLAWDNQFKAGIWSSGTRSPHTLRRVAALCAGGTLLEFGCGEGHLPFLLPGGSFARYTGYDISGVAIQRARQQALALQRDDIRFERCDMTEWPGSAAATLVLAEECLYYLSPSAIRRFLQRCMASLAPNGSILVIVHSASKHARTVDLCRQVCHVVDETLIGSRLFLTLTAPAAVETRASNRRKPES